MIYKQHSVLFIYVFQYFIPVIREVFLNFLNDGIFLVIAYFEGQETFFLYDLMGIFEDPAVEIQTVITPK